jgi:hypothetical protein
MDVSVMQCGDGSFLLSVKGKKGVIRIKPKGVGKISEENVMYVTYLGKRRNFEEEDGGLRILLPTGTLLFKEEPTPTGEFIPF